MGVIKHETLKVCAARAAGGADFYNLVFIEVELHTLEMLSRSGWEVLCGTLHPDLGKIAELLLSFCSVFGEYLSHCPQSGLM